MKREKVQDKVTSRNSIRNVHRKVFFFIFCLIFIYTNVLLNKTYRRITKEDELLRLPSPSSKLERWSSTHHDNKNSMKIEIASSSSPEEVGKDRCSCIRCEEDKKCGMLWYGNQYSIPKTQYNLQHKKVHIVISYCKSDLSWLSNEKILPKGMPIKSIHIISKCNGKVIGAPSIATIEELPNIGRCDHSYAYYITTVLKQKVKEDEEKDAIVLFLKDDISAENKHQGNFFKFESLSYMVNMAASPNGFQCRLILDPKRRIQYTSPETNETHKAIMSAYFDSEALSHFRMDEYEQNMKNYTATDQVEFKSNFTNLGVYSQSLGIGPMQKIVPVCYGGVFAASVTQIKQRDLSLWKRIQASLERGNNIEEGHFVERSWAYLLSPPLEDYKINALQEGSDFLLNWPSLIGDLLVSQGKVRRAHHAKTCTMQPKCVKLWQGNPNAVEANPVKFTKDVHLVISHCENSLAWLSSMHKAKFKIASIHIISKCGVPIPKGIPKNTTVEVLPNIGRHDHSYAHYITTILHQKVKPENEKNSVVLFLKDTMLDFDSSVDKYFTTTSLHQMVHMATSDNGFQCRQTVDPKKPLNVKKSWVTMSTYHDTKTLLKFSLDRSVANNTNSTGGHIPFKSKYTILGKYYKSLEVELLEPMVPVCYGGSFAVSVSQITKHDDAVWKRLEDSMARGSNIEESHFAERSWAMLLSPPLKKDQIELLRRSASFAFNSVTFKGALLEKSPVANGVKLKSAMENLKKLRNGRKIATLGKANNK